MAKTTKVSNQILVRVYFLFALFVAFGGIICLRIATLQFNSDKWNKIGEEDRIFFTKEVADRGNILADDGTILATSMPFYKVAIDPSQIDTTKFEKFDDSLKVLSQKLYLYFGKQANDSTIDSVFYYRKIREAISKGDRHLYLTRKTVNYKEFKLMKTWAILNRTRKEGGALIVEKFNNKRFYPYGEMGRATLGTVANDTMGIRGIEHSYNRVLRGRDGYYLAQRIAGNKMLPIDQYGKEASEDGLDVLTTLDVDLQDIAETALRKGVITAQAKSGTAILMEVSTGKIKAIANYPETYNYAIANLIEPGSTFKLVSALAALEEKVIDTDDTVDTGNGTIKIGDKTINDSYGHGKISFNEVFALSSNVGVAKVITKGFEKNPKRFIHYVEKFGFSKPSNEQIKGEPKPELIRPGDKLWSGATLPSMSIGYSVRVTPLQMLAFYNAVANRGKLVKPYFIAQVRDNSSIIQDFTPAKSNEQICSIANLEKVKKMMMGVVEFGTAKNIKDMPFKVAGKTGTARKFMNGAYVSRYQASFVGFFPADNPQYTCFVMIDEPSAGEIYGADVAAPIFKEIAEQAHALNRDMSTQLVKLNHAPFQPPTPKVLRAKSAEVFYKEMGVTTSNIPKVDWVASRSDGHQVNVKEFKKRGIIPDVTGMSARDAVNLLEEMGIKVSVEGVGKVRRQSLLAGTKIRDGMAVWLYLD
ncbi:MAG: penicillin-binding protein [Bacteroidia bacterium]